MGSIQSDWRFHLSSDGSSDYLPTTEYYLAKVVDGRMMFEEAETFWWIGDKVKRNLLTSILYHKNNKVTLMGGIFFLNQSGPHLYYSVIEVRYIDATHFWGRIKAYQFGRRPIIGLHMRSSAERLVLLKGLPSGMAGKADEVLIAWSLSPFKPRPQAFPISFYGRHESLWRKKIWSIPLILAVVAYLMKVAWIPLQDKLYGEETCVGDVKPCFYGMMPINTYFSKKYFCTLKIGPIDLLPSRRDLKVEDSPLSSVCKSIYLQHTASFWCKQKLGFASFLTRFAYCYR